MPVVLLNGLSLVYSCPVVRVQVSWSFIPECYQHLFLQSGSALVSSCHLLICICMCLQFFKYQLQLSIYCLFFLQLASSLLVLYPSVYQIFIVIHLSSFVAQIFFLFGMCVYMPLRLCPQTLLLIKIMQLEILDPTGDEYLTSVFSQIDTETFSEHHIIWTTGELTK